MKLVSFNIQYGLGRDGRYDLDRTAKAVRAADVIAFQEVERHWKRTGMVDQAAELARRLPEHHWVFGANFDMDASYRDGQGRLVNRRKQFGNMLLSRLPIVSSRNHLLPKFGTVDQHGMQRGALEGVIVAPGGPVRVYSVHLSHLASGTRMPEVEALIAIHTRSFGEGGAWSGGHPDSDAGWIEEPEPPMPRDAIVMGDLNFTADSPEYERLVGPVSPEYGRVHARDRFLDAWVMTGHGELEGVTCHGTDADKRIDYCLLSFGLRDRVRSAWIDSACPASDHLPYWVDFDL